MIGTWIFGVLLALVPCSAAFGQELHVSSSEGKLGETVLIEVSIRSSPEEAPSVLKWEMIYPAQLLELQPEPESGNAARASEKLLRCAQHQTYSYVCILGGGQKPVQDGPIAIFRFKIRMDAKTGRSAIRIDHIEAITKTLESVKLTAIEGQVGIR